MRFKLTNKTFSPLHFSVGIVPARGSIIIDNVPKGLRSFEKSGKISIKEYKEK